MFVHDDAFIFLSMKEYLDYFGATVEDYELSPHEYEGNTIVKPFKPVEDTRFSTHSNEMETIDGIVFQHVNWGEEKYCMIPEADINTEFWTVYEWVPKLSGYASTGEIFETEKEARNGL